MATERDHQTTSTTSGFIFPNEIDRLGYGQTVTPSEDYVVEQIRFTASRHKLNPGNCYVSIETTVGGLPTGDKITDNAVFACPNTETLVTVDFVTQPTLISGTKYAIVFENPSGVIGTPPWYDDGKRLQLYGEQLTGARYANGDVVYLETAAWDTDTDRDLYFSLWGSEPLPSKATTPAPTDAADDVTLDQATLTWVDGGGATSYDVYYGNNADVLAAVDNTDTTGIYRGNQAGTSFTVAGVILGSPYEYVVNRYWRIDSVNAGGTTKGDVWSFTTIRFKPITVTYFYSTTGQYYYLLVQSDGTYGDPPPTGVEDTDYVYLAAGYEPNFIRTNRVLVGVANSKVWVEDV